MCNTSRNKMRQHGQTSWGEAEEKCLAKSNKITTSFKSHMRFCKGIFQFSQGVFARAFLPELFFARAAALAGGDFCAGGGSGIDGARGRRRNTNVEQKRSLKRQYS